MTKFTLIILCFFSISLVTAQNNKFQAGPIIGAEFPFSKDDITGAFEFNYSVRPSAGAAFKLSFGETFSLQPEAMVQLREVKISEKRSNVIRQRNSTVYIVIPVYINYAITDTFSVLAGPRLGVDIEFSTTHSSGTNGSYSNTTGESPEFSGVLGVQYTTPIKIFISLKGAYAFTSPEYADNINETAFMIGLGRFF